ncbi:unnamed protein product [Lepidochelys kempii]
MGFLLSAFDSGTFIICSAPYTPLEFYTLISSRGMALHSCSGLLLHRGWVTYWGSGELYKTWGYVCRGEREEEYLFVGLAVQALGTMHNRGTFFLGNKVTQAQAVEGSSLILHTCLKC